MFNRHLAASKQWYPFEDVPWDRRADFAEEAWSAEQYPLSQGVQSAIIVNVLTEDNLPVLHPHPHVADLGRPPASRVEPALDGRGVAALGRDPRLDPRDARHRPLPPRRRPNGADVQGPGPPEPERGRDDRLCEFQELATQVAHRNTGMALDKTKRGKKIMSKVAGDEGLHHAFYRDLVLAGLEIDALDDGAGDPERATLIFKMPGTATRGFDRHEVEIALAGIFGAQQF